MKFRSVLALSAVLAAGLAGGASAAVKKPCQLIKDATGDAVVLAAKDDGLDIVTADLASDAKKITAVIRLKTYAATDPLAPMGRKVYMQWNAPGGDFPLYMAVSIDPGFEPYFTYGHLETLATGNGSYTKDGDANGVLDTAKHEVRITAPISGFAAHGKHKPGAKLTGIEASTKWLIGAAGGGFVEPADTATSAKGYVAGTATCVVVGK
jgi:hypothetical protein